MPDVQLTSLASFIAKLEAAEPVESATRQTKYFGESGYTTLSSAKASAAAEYSSFGRLTNFIIAENIAVSGVDNSGQHLVVKFEGNGRITTTNSTDVYTIYRRDNVGSKQVFFGPGQVKYAKGAIKGMFNMGEWVPEPTAATPYPVITDKMWEGMRQTLYNNNGGIIWVPNNYYYTYHSITLQVGGFMGYGSTENDGPAGPSANTRGPGIEQLTNDIPVFQFLPGSRNVTVQGLRVTLPTASDESAFLIEGDGTVDAGFVGITIKDCVVQGGRTNLRINDTSGLGLLLVMHVMVDNCRFQEGTVACFENNSVNGQYSFFRSDFAPKQNGTSHVFHLEECGMLNVKQCNGTGTIVSPATKNFTFTAGDVNVAAKTVTKVGHGQVTNDPIYLSNSGGASPTGWPVARKFFLSVSGNVLKFHNTAVDSNAGTNPVDPLTVGTGTQTVHSTRPNNTSTQPDAVFYLAGQYFGGISVDDWQDEGFNHLLKMQGINDYATAIDFRSVRTQGMIYTDDCEVTINLHGGRYLAGSFKDSINGKARINDFGAQFYTYGVGGPINDYGGYAVPSPQTFDNFIGSSVFEQGGSRSKAHMFRRAANGVGIFGIAVQNQPNALYELSLIWSRIPSGARAGWWKQTNSMALIDPAQAGVEEQGGRAINGPFLNLLTTAANVSVAAVATLDLKQGNHFTFSSDSDREIRVINKWAAANQEVTVEITTPNTTSRNITHSSDFSHHGTFATGTVSGKVHCLKYLCNGTKLIEQGRVPGTGGGGGSVATDVIFDAKGDIAVGTGADASAKLAVGSNDTFPVADSSQSTGWRWTNYLAELFIRGASSALRIYDRATDASSWRIYSPTSGKLSFYRDLSGQDLFTIDGTEAVFTVAPKVATDNAYSESGWNTSTRLASENAVRDEIERVRPRGVKIPSNVAWTSDTTLATTGLSVTLPIGEYQIEIQIVATVNGGGLKTDFGGTAVIGSGSRLFGTSHQLNIDEAVFTPVSWVTVGDDINWGSETGDRAITIKGAINVTTAGTFILRAAQQSSNASATTIYAGGSGTFTPLAT